MRSPAITALRDPEINFMGPRNGISVRSLLMKPLVRPSRSLALGKWNAKPADSSSGLATKTSPLGDRLTGKRAGGKRRHVTSRTDGRQVVG